MFTAVKKLKLSLKFKSFNVDSCKEAKVKTCNSKFLMFTVVKKLKLSLQFKSFNVDSCKEAKVKLAVQKF